jgi:hypothetical protein
MERNQSEITNKLRNLLIMYTEDNIIGVKFFYGSNQYEIVSIKGDYPVLHKNGQGRDILCFHNIVHTAELLNKGTWKPLVPEIKTTYDIY